MLEQTNIKLIRNVLTNKITLKKKVYFNMYPYNRCFLTKLTMRNLLINMYYNMYLLIMNGELSSNIYK